MPITTSVSTKQPPRPPIPEEDKRKFQEEPINDPYKFFNK